MFRLFVAFRPPAAILDQLLALMEGVTGARWQSKEQLHLTLRYIGDVDRHQAEDVATALQAVRFQPFSIKLSGVGNFDHKDQSRPIWAGVNPIHGLNDLHKKIDRAFIRTGLEPESRAYIPHITLARFGARFGAQSGNDKADVRPWLHVNEGLCSAPFVLDHIALLESDIGKDGVRYQEVMRVDCAGAQ